MAKLIKGDSVQNIITDGDVIVTSPSKIGKTLDEVLVEQQSDIDRLKSNIKYIYAYGGVGGSGSGGSGSTEKPISVLITLNGTSVNGGDAIILDGRGVYKLYIKVSNAGGKNLYMGYAINGAVTDKMVNQTLNGDNKYKKEIDVNLNANGELNIRIDDDEGNTIGYYSQKYIVDSDIFNVTLNYMDEEGASWIMSEPHECFVDDPNRKNRHFKIDYSIFLTDYKDVKVDFEIDNATIEKYETNGTSIIIPIERENSGIFINGEEILQNKYMGAYTLRATLTYIIAGKEVVRTRSLTFTIVPSGLYVNVRTNRDVLYDSVDKLIEDIKAGVNKHITIGSSLMLYCKVFEGDIIGDKLRYTTYFQPFDTIVDGEGNIIYDENGNIQWDDIDVDISDTLIEQEESKNGVSITFSTKGIKKIVISTTSLKGGGTETFEKYVYVKELDSLLPWYNRDRYGVILDSYFRANQGNDTYGGYFPRLSSGEGILGLNVSSNPIELTNSTWNTNISGNICTIITLGIQVSNINSEDAKIMEVYQKGLNVPKFTLRTTRLFTDISSNINKIAIPTEILNKNDNKKYHLIQIIRNFNGSEFEDSLYIDGLLESVDRNVSNTSLVISKIILNNINICYNLINLQYAENLHTSDSGDNVKFNPDGYAYQYWLSYKEKYVNSSNEGARITDEEKSICANMDRIFFDGTNVEVDQGIITDIAALSELPTVVFEYECGSNEDISSFMKMMWGGRPNGDTTFGSRDINLYWIPKKEGLGSKLSDYAVKIPETLSTYNGDGFTANWTLDLQGTSTMRNRIKNYSLRIDNKNDEKSRILFSPKFNIDDPKTFLPDVEWTIKADIADSAHANNTSIGKFVNDVCTKFDTNIPGATEEAKRFVKNTLEGIPVLLYFMCSKKDADGNTDSKIYYFGIYNFNLGRKSYYNLGYTGGIVDETNKLSDFMRVFNSIKSGNDNTKYFQGDVFTFAVGDVSITDGLVIGEIQDNYPEFDFHQYGNTVLFKSSDKDNIAAMFGSDSKITARDKNAAKGALQSLVKGVAKAGKYCFIRSGRADDLVTSMHEGNCVNRYDEGKIPDPIYQMEYENNKLIWKEDTSCENVYDTDLKELISTFVKEDDTINKPLLNYTSASEYYTICMAFGMVDSVLKNMNLKSFSGYTHPYFHCAFYDMDCALEEDNSGKETVSYLAATDYWYSPIDSKTNKVQPVQKKNDYWDRVNGGQGFDFTSSYLLAVIKYAKPIFESFINQENDEKLKNDYPQNFWAKLRRVYRNENDKGGGLQSADYFINNYFKSGITTTFEYLASLNYRVKYLYKGETFNNEDNIIVQPLANAAAFNGSRRVKVKNWLTKRLRYIDVMMNISGLNTPVSDNVTITVPAPDDAFKSDLMDNPDITILHSAFDSGNLNQALNSFSGEVEIYAPKHTPFIFSTGTNNSTLYLLPGGIDRPNLIYMSVYATGTARFYGSGMFTSVNKVETMLTQYKSIISDNIEKITYGGTAVAYHSDGLTINAKSATEISLNIPNMGGSLLIDDNCISLSKINIADSGFYGDFTRFPNLKEVNISGVNAETQTIYIGNSEFLKGDNIIVSGKDEDHKTTLSQLQILDSVGNFNFTNTNIQTIFINNEIDNGESDPDLLSEFSIYGDKALTNLTLYGFRKVSITGCNNLTTLSIDDALEELYINLEKLNEENESKLTTIYRGEKKVELKEDGKTEYNVFDFTNYPNLKRVTLINCDKLEWVKLPDQDIETDGMHDNINLQWIDTGILPAFLDEDNIKTDKDNGDGYIEGVGDYSDIKFPIYSVGPKLILCTNSTFYNCPKYAMLRSDYNKAKEMIDYISSKNPAYTNIIVSSQCTSLANTFSISGGSDDDKFNMQTAMRFIEKCVPDEVKANITSLSGCFRGRKKVKYSLSEATTEMGNISNGDYLTTHLHPMLDKYASLNDISGMYENTNVTFISKNLLDLPSDKNTSDNPLNWDMFIQGMSKMNISSDALYNISYRLGSYSYIGFNIYEYNSKEYVLAGKDEDNMFKICDFFYPFDDGKKIYSEEKGYTFAEDVLRYEHIQSIDVLNFGEQYIDFRGMFELFPNIRTISSFLYGNLRKYNISGLLKPCKNIVSIIQSFCDSGIKDSNNTQIIDLFEFFNWTDNTTDVTHLFEGLDPLSNGFSIKKTITYDNFKTVLEKITEYSNLTRLTNIFSYCTITGYKDATEEDRVIKFTKHLPNIVNISNLFENCISDYRPFKGTDGGDKGIYEGGVLYLGRPFFEQISSFNIAQRTLANTYLASPLTYDYFCKRKDFKEKEVLLSENQSDKAKLIECEYSSDIINLKECFYNTKFVNCKNWFDHNSDVNVEIINKENRNYISTGEGVENKHSERGFKYYIYNDMEGSFDAYVLDNDVFDDCLDNYTDYVPNNSIQNKYGKEFVWYNHDLVQDFKYYGNIKGGDRPFDPSNSNGVDTIQKTYCCLPPDLLYGCSSTAIVDGLFANSNIIGVIPRNLTKKVKSQSISNIFRNVNIMPNLEYYYDVNGRLDSSILHEVVIDGDLIGDESEYKVVFRDEVGKLKKRKPIASDRNLGQFVYVPVNFTTSGTLMNAFNFRYNLPRHWEIGKEVDKTDVSYYKSTNDFNNAILSGNLDTSKLSYHSQYYFITDGSVNWSNIYDAKSIFITDSQDVDFSNKHVMGKIRDYYDGNTESNITKMNTWTIDERVSTHLNWTTYNMENFNIDLNLCGKKNEYNMIEDNGCPIALNRSVHLDNFVSGILTIFLNGRVFDREFTVDKLTTSNHKSSGSSVIIGYYGFGKNIILPHFSGSPLDDKLSFIPISSDIIYYDFMVDNDITSKENYHNYLAKNKLGEGKYLFDTNYNKYTLK